MAPDCEAKSSLEGGLRRGPEGGMVEAGGVAGQVVGGQVGRGLWEGAE